MRLGVRAGKEELVEYLGIQQRVDEMLYSIQELFPLLSLRHGASLAHVNGLISNAEYEAALSRLEILGLQERCDLWPEMY